MTMKLCSLPVHALAAAVCLLWVAECHAGCTTRPLETLDIPAPNSIVGRTRVCLDGDRLKVALKATNLESDHAYSAWWVYFADTSKCLAANDCGPRDLVEPHGGTRQMLPDGRYAGGDLPQGVIGRMASGLALPSGKLVLTGELRRFVFEKQSEMWLLLMAHGPADRLNASRLARQLLTPEEPALGEPFMGRSEDGRNSRWTAVTVFSDRDLAPEGVRR
jgi:hypothetical protein